MIAGLLVVPSVALAADAPADVMLDGVVTVVHVDAEDGPIAGATVTIATYRDPAAPIQVLNATTDGNGRAEVSGVARAADGATPVLLDVRSDLAASVLNEAGCTETASWFAAAATTAGPSVAVVFDSSSKSVVIDCPEPTAEPEAPVVPTSIPNGPGGGVLAATGRPQLTPPATDTIGVPAGSTSGGSGLVGVLAALTTVGFVVVTAARSAVRRSRPRS